MTAKHFIYYLPRFLSAHTESNKQLSRGRLFGANLPPKNRRWSPFWKSSEIIENFLSNLYNFWGKITFGTPWRRNRMLIIFDESNEQSSFCGMQNIRRCLRNICSMTYYKSYRIIKIDIDVPSVLCFKNKTHNQSQKWILIGIFHQP